MSGTLIGGRYELGEMLGRGGMAEVYRATLGPDPETFAFDVALKRLLPEHKDDPAQLDLFVTEADVAKLLKHPNLVHLYDLHTDDRGDRWVVMEYVFGESLAQWINRYPTGLPPELVKRVDERLERVRAGK